MFACVDTWLSRAHRSLLGVSPTAAFTFSLLVRFAGVCLAPPEAPLFVFPFLGTVTPATTESAATSSSASIDGVPSLQPGQLQSMAEEVLYEAVKEKQKHDPDPKDEAAVALPAAEVAAALARLR